MITINRMAKSKTCKNKERKSDIKTIKIFVCLLVYMSFFFWYYPKIEDV